jgi:hypothetical protein
VRATTLEREASWEKRVSESLCYSCYIFVAELNHELSFALEGVNFIYKVKVG